MAGYEGRHMKAELKGRIFRLKQDDPIRQMHQIAISSLSSGFYRSRAVYRLRHLRLKYLASDALHS